MTKTAFSLLCRTLLISPMPARAQNPPSPAEKPGVLEILSRADYVTPGSGFIKADLAADLQRIVDLVGLIRQNPVLADIKGFLGRARI